MEQQDQMEQQGQTQQDRKCPWGLECNGCRLQASITMSRPGMQPQQVQLCAFQAVLAILSSGSQPPPKRVVLPYDLNPRRTN